MTPTFSETEILATDARGRVRLSNERKAELLAEFDRSGMTLRRFAEWSGVNYQTFCGWIARRRNAAKLAVTRPSALPAGSTSWAEAVVEPMASRVAPGVVKIVFPGDAIMEVADLPAAALSAEVLRQWANLPGLSRPC